MFELRSGPTYKDAVERNQAQLEEWRPAIEQVADLLLRTSPERLPDLATAHFAASSLQSERGSIPPIGDVVDEVRRWKPALEEQDVAEAVFTLNVLGWTSVPVPSDSSFAPDPASQVA